MVFCQQSVAEHKKDHADNTFQEELVKALSLKINAFLKCLGTAIIKKPNRGYSVCSNLSCTSLLPSWGSHLSILVTSITVCFLRSKTRIPWVNGSFYITGCHLSSVKVLYTMRASNKAQKITSDLSHHGHPLFTFWRTMQVHMYKNYPS